MRTKLFVLAVAVLSVAMAVSSQVVVAQPQSTVAQASDQDRDDQARTQAQPKMSEALEHLREAEKALQQGSHDKGGHRVKALQLVKQAESEIQAGIEYDNTHLTGKEKR